MQRIAVAIVFVLLTLSHLSHASKKVQDFDSYDHKSGKRSVDLGEASVIPFGPAQSNVQGAYSYVLNSVSPFSSKYIYYPYSLTVTPSTSLNFAGGAVISTDALLTGASGFNFLLNSTNVTTTRAKAFYDVNIAILQLQTTEWDGSIFDYTYDSFSYCPPLNNWIGKYVECWVSSDYRHYIATTPNHEATSVVYVNQTDIQTGFLFNNGSLRFGILIVPDISNGVQSNITQLLGTTGQTAIQQFVAAGGVIYSSAKGALVLEGLGFFQTGTFNPNSLLTAVGFAAPVICNLTQSGDNSDWIRHSLCFSPPLLNGKTASAILSAPTVNTKLLASGTTVVAAWDPSSGLLLTKNQNGFLSSVSSSSSSTSYPYILHQLYDQGQIIVDLGSPVSNESYFPWFMNVLFHTMSKPLILDSQVISPFRAIPALEQISLDVQLNLTNLYSETLTNVNYYVFIPNGIQLVSVPSGCNTYSSSSPVTIPSSYLNDSIYYECSPSGNSLSAFTTQVLTFTLYIWDVTVTQQQTGIPLIYPYITYVIPSLDNYEVTLNFGPVTVDAYSAALLRTDINADPLGIYPIVGRGNYVDNIQWAENKANTVALNVVHTSVIPLVTPIVDCSDQAKVIRTLEFDYSYYLKTENGVSNYVYPFVNPKKPYGQNDTRDSDYIDWQRFTVRGNTQVADWDTPTKVSKIVRDPSIFNTSLTSSVTGVCTSPDCPSDQEVTYEQYFPDANIFFEHASQRILAYLDTTDPVAYATYNQPQTWLLGSAPSWKLNSAGTAMRSNLIFGRQDVYWYSYVNASETPLPQGVSSWETVFSLDRYQNPACGVSATPPVVAGYYSSSVTTATGDDQPGLKPNEYANQLKSDCSRVWIDPGSGVTLPEGVSLGHYIVRLSDNPEVQSGDDAMYFVKNTTAIDSEWYYDPDGTIGSTKFGTYKEVKLKYAWGTDFLIDPTVSRQGGRITITLPSDLTFKVSDPVGLGAISYSADQVAFVEHTYDSTTNSIVTYYNRGNMPNENNGKNSSIQLNIEYLNATSNFTATVTFEEMFYDISAPNNPVPYQRYELTSTVSLTFSQYVVLSLPALVMKYSLERNNAALDLSGSYILPLENIQTFVRQGNFLQELKAHRTVYASVENHPVSDTGIVGNSGGFSWITNIGESSIPFKEYLTTGAKQMIPAAPITSHLSWQDIWGRTWNQPIRSVFADVAPLPGPLRNFVMTTTYEMLRPDSSERVLQWQSDESLIVRAQLKLFNGYFKFFDITGCAANWNAVVLPGNTPLITTSTDLDQYVVLEGYTPSYGVCFQDQGTVLEAELLSAATRALIANASHCSEQANFYVGCDGLVSAPHLEHRVAGNNATVWNYSPQVNAHYPQNYISPTMWDLTHADYDDSVYTKAYAYHMDNWLPNIDSGLPRPENIIAFPIYKGLGYSMSYSNNITHPNFPGKSGWWSDNLQNRDETLLAGQTTINTVSVGAADLTTSVGWVPINQLTGASGIADNALKNIYTCEFNRQRVKVNPANEEITFLTNVLYNNVVPVDPTLDQNDPRLSSYACDLTQGMYTPSNISQYPNYLATETPRDWLYFASNLRGEAKENINILYNLEPLATVTNSGVEGITEVQDGGTFVYWNPGLGPNAFLIYDDPTNNVIATRTDLTVTQQVYPTTIPTYDSVVINHIHMEDTAEINRQWTSAVYTNNYGFGDSTVQVFVGGADGTSAIILPGETTQISVTFFNNAGFDWNLLAGAFPEIDYGVLAYNAMDLGSNLKNTIQVPSEYNFMTVGIPPELIPYVTIIPSNIFASTPPMLFDFTSNNVLSIRDGFQGDYYYQLTLASDLPSSLQGRLYEFNVTLNTQYFEMLPGPTDPTGIHDYTISIPPFAIAIPYTSGPNSGAVFYTSGHAHNFALAVSLNSAFTPISAQFLHSTSYIEQLGSVAAQPLERLTNLKSFWKQLEAANNDSVPFSVTKVGSTSVVLFDLSNKGNQFPFPNPLGGPEIASIDILLYTTASYIPNGWVYPTYGAYVNFTDDVGKAKTGVQPNALVVRASGADLGVNYTPLIYDKNGYPFNPQALHTTDFGFLTINATVTNTGDDIAYSAQFSVQLSAGFNWVPSRNKGIDSTTTEDPKTGDTIAVHINSGYDLPPGELLTISLSFSFISFQAVSDRFTKRNVQQSSRLVVSSFTGTIDLTSTPGELPVNQTITTPYSIPIITTPRTVVTLSGTSQLGYKVALTLDVSQLSSTVVSSSDTAYVWGRSNINFGTSAGAQGVWYILSQTSSPHLTDNVGSEVPNGVVPQVNYVVSVISIKSQSTITQSNVYEYAPQNDAGAIVGLVFGLIFALLFLILLIWLAVRYRKYLKKPRTRILKKTKAKNPVPSDQVAMTPVEETPVPENPAAPLGSRPSYRHKVANIDYLMTGARRVTVKDGNPTAVEAVIEQPKEEDAFVEEDLDEEIEVEEDPMNPCEWLMSLLKKKMEAP